MNDMPQDIAADIAALACRNARRRLNQEIALGNNPAHPAIIRRIAIDTGLRPLDVRKLLAEMGREGRNS